MAYIMIEPVNIHSIRSAMRVVRLLRSDREIADNVIISIVINGADEHHIIVSSDYKYNEICALLNGNQDAYNFYNADWPAPTY